MKQGTRDQTYGTRAPAPWVPFAIGRLHRGRHLFLETLFRPQARGCGVPARARLVPLAPTAPTGCAFLKQGGAAYLAQLVEPFKLDHSYCRHHKIKKSLLQFVMLCDTGGGK